MKMTKLLIIILVLAPVLSPPTSYIPITSAEEQPENIYVRYKYSVELSSSDGQKGYIVVYVDYYLNFTEDRVIVTLSYIKAEISAVLTTSPYSTRTVLTPSEQLHYTVVIPMNEYYTRFLTRGLTGGAPPTDYIIDVGGRVNAMLDMVIDVSYEECNGYPAIRYRIGGSTTSSASIQDFSGDLYFHAAYLLPLYMDIRISFTGGYGFGTSSPGTGRMKLEILDTNLPKKSVVGSKDMGSLEIVTAGFPGARIKVYGEKGSDKLIVVNDGTQPGYIVVIYKGESSSLAVIGQSNTGNIELYDVPPGTNKTIVLRTLLPENVEISTEDVVGGLPPSSTIYILFFAAVMAGLVWFLLRLIRIKPEQEAETPAITEKPETIEPGGEQPAQ